MQILLLIAGLIALLAGAELLVRSASRMAGALGIPALVIGLTVVAFGTSAPEFAVSLKSVLAGQTDIATGNVVGSNIFNILLILGVASMLAPLTVSAQLVRLDVPLMIGVSMLFLLFALNGMVERWEGVVLFSGLIGYMFFLYWNSKKTGSTAGIETPEEAKKGLHGPSAWIVQVMILVSGLALLILGSRWLVDSAVEIARTLGVSELVIGLTIVAGGTSLPELATSVLAGIRGERDIAIGNVVGSNIFNLLGVLGVSAVVAPGGGLPVSVTALALDIPLMTAVAIITLPVFFTGYRMVRWEGALFLVAYVLYTLILLSTSGATRLEFGLLHMAVILSPALVVILYQSFTQWKMAHPAKG